MLAQPFSIIYSPVVFSFGYASFFVSIRRTTGFKPFYTTIATVTTNLIVAVAIVLLNLYVAVGISCRILQPLWSTHFPDVATSIGVEAAL